MHFPTERHIRKTPRSIYPRAPQAIDRAIICSKNRKIVPYRGDSPSLEMARACPNLPYIIPA